MIRHLLLLLACTAAGAASAKGPTGVVLHAAFGGEIFGFDIDQNGREGVLSESKQLTGTTLLAAVETFDQASGTVTKVVKKLEGKDDFLTLGVTGASIGLVEREHVRDIFVAKRIYRTIDPLNARAFTGQWTPPLKQPTDIITSVAENQTPGPTAVLAFHNTGAGGTFVFGADIGANTTGQFIPLTNPAFGECCGPQLAYDPVHNKAIVASALGSVGGPPPEIAIADLAGGRVVTFQGVAGPPPFGSGAVNGLAYDPDDGIAVTSTELDGRLEYYDIAKKTGIQVLLPGQQGQFFAASDVQYDRVNKLFLVAQENSGVAAGSTIYAFDTKGNLVETLNGFHFSNASKVIATHIAFNPATRTGYVDGPDQTVTELTQFTY